MTFLIITDKDYEGVINSFTKKRLWVENIQRIIQLKKLLKEKAPSYKPNEVIGVFVPEEPRTYVYNCKWWQKPVKELFFKKEYLALGVTGTHPIGFGMLVLDKKKRDKRIKKSKFIT